MRSLLDLCLDRTYGTLDENRIDRIAKPFPLQIRSLFCS